MNGANLIVDAFSRVQQVVHGAVDGLTPQQLTERLDAEANSIAWLIWHLTRVQDDHVADALGLDQIWLAHGWHERFELPFKPEAVGYGQTSAEVGAVRVESPDLLTGYYDAVHAQTVEHVANLAEADFDRIVDESWTPAVTLGVRLVSVVSDTLQHAGQAAYVRGILLRR